MMNTRFSLQRNRMHGLGRHDIDMTNIIDCFLILFVVMLIARGAVAAITTVSSRLQAGSGPTIRAEEVKRKVLVSFDAAGGILWDKERISGIAELETRARRLASAQSETAVLVEGDREARYGQSLVIKNSLQRAGVKTILELMKTSRGDR